MRPGAGRTESSAARNRGVRGGGAGGMGLEGRLPSAPYTWDTSGLTGDPPLSPLGQPLADRHPNSHGPRPATAQAEEGGEKGQRKTKVLSDDNDHGPRWEGPYGGAMTLCHHTVPEPQGGGFSEWRPGLPLAEDTSRSLC